METKQKNTIVDNYYRGCRPYVVGGLSYCVALIVICMLVWIYYPESLIYVISFSLVIGLLLCVYKIITLSRALRKKYGYVEDENNHTDPFHPNNKI